MTGRGRQLALILPSPDEDGDQLDMIEAAGTERVGPSTITADGPPVAGQVIAWRTWCGEAVALVEYVGRDGHVSIRSRDGHSEAHERMPSGARRLTPDEAAAWRASAAPAFPPGFD